MHRLIAYNVEKLDAIYKEALRNAEDDDHRRALQASQDAWVKFFEADAAAAAWNARGGSAGYSSQAAQKLYQLRLRMHQLLTPFLQGWPEVPRVKNPAAPAHETE